MIPREKRDSKNRTTNVRHEQSGLESRTGFRRQRGVTTTQRGVPDPLPPAEPLGFQTLAPPGTRDKKEVTRYLVSH